MLGIGKVALGQGKKLWAESDLEGLPVPLSSGFALEDRANILNVLDDPGTFHLTEHVLRHGLGLVHGIGGNLQHIRHAGANL